MDSSINVINLIITSITMMLILGIFIYIAYFHKMLTSIPDDEAVKSFINQ